MTHTTLPVGLPVMSSWDSMEGVPDWPDVLAEPRSKTCRYAWQDYARGALDWTGVRLPGLGLAAMLAFSGEWLAQWLGNQVLGFEKSPISPIPVAIILGLLICNLVGLPDLYQVGLRTSVRHILRFGIVLLGLRQGLLEVGHISLNALPVLVCCIGGALLLVPWAGRKLRLPRRLGTLVAVGTSICGVSAILATAPAIDAEEDEISYAVACVTLFGLIGLLFYPLLAHVAFDAYPWCAGVFLGTAIHDTAQVIGAGFIYQQQFQAPEVLSTAAVVKLVRNLCMALVIPLMAYLYHREKRSDGRGSAWLLKQVVPLFVLAFVGMTFVRTLGDLNERPFGVIDRASWKSFLGTADRASAFCLATAMAAVGLSTGLSRLKKLGLRPFLVGLTAAAVVGLISFTILKAEQLLGLL